MNALIMNPNSLPHKLDADEQWDKSFSQTHDFNKLLATGKLYFEIYHSCSKKVVSFARTAYQDMGLKGGTNLRNGTNEGRNSSMEHQCACGRRWWLDEYKGIQREPGSLACDCGQQIISWDGSVSYSKIRMFDEPSTTTAELISDEGLRIPAESLISVSHVQTHEWNAQAHVHVTYRTITYAGGMVRVREEELLAAVPG